jgi:hypothetical protein
MLLSGSAARWEERIRRVLVLVAVFTVPAVIAMQLTTVADPDLWCHLRTGQWIAQHHIVPATDQFSAFGIDKPWVAYSWLFEVVLYFVYSVGGLLGLLVFKLFMILAVTAAVYHLVGRLQQDFTWQVVLTSVAMISMAQSYTPRPWLMTILFFVIEIDVLFAYRGQGKIRNLYALPPLFLLWANMHVQFFYGLFVLFLFAIEPPLSRMLATHIPQIRPITRPAAPLWVSTVICTAVTLVNPYGIRLYTDAFDLITQKSPFKYVTEFQALSFRQLSDYLLLAMLLAAVFMIAWTRCADWLYQFLLIAGAILGFRCRRDLWFLAVVSTAILAACLPARPNEKYVTTRAQRLGIGVAVVAALVSILAFRGFSNAMLEKQVIEAFPYKAADFISHHELPGPLFNNYDWGGYLIWKLPSLPVSIDGRTDVHWDQRIVRSVETWAGKHDWSSDPDLISAGLVIGPIDAPLTAILRLVPDYQVVYEDKTAVVFARKTPSSWRDVARTQSPKREIRLRLLRYATE